MTLKFLSDASVTAGGFQIRYVTMDAPSKAGDGKNATSQGKTNFLSGKFGIMWDNSLLSISSDNKAHQERNDQMDF